MSTYLKPQSPLYNQPIDSYIYPLTTVDQVIMEDGTRLSAKLSNIVNKAETAMYTGVFVANGWSGTSSPYTQTLTIPGMLVSDNPFADVNLEDVSDAQGAIDGWALIGRVAVSENDTVVGYCYEEKPTIDIPVFFKVVR